MASGIVAKIVHSDATPEAKLDELSSLTEGLMVALCGRTEWAWRLGPDTYVKLQLSGPLGPREMRTFLLYAGSLGESVPDFEIAPPPAPKARP